MPRRVCTRCDLKSNSDKTDNTADLVDFIHPVAGVLKHQLAGLHGGRHHSRVQRPAGVLRRFLAASLPLHADELFSSPPCWDSLRSCDLGAQRADRKTTATGSGGVLSPGGSSPAPCVTRRPSPAAPGASTPAGDTGRIQVRRCVGLLRFPAVMALPGLSCCPH